MKKRIPSLLATMIASALYSQQGLAADLATQCMLGVPSYDRPLVEGRPGDLPVTINADHAKGNYPDNAVFTGNVDINQGNSRLRADEVQLHQQQAAGQAQPVRTVDALGNVHYDDNQVILKGPKAWSNLNTKDTNVWQGDYQMVGRQGRGTADLMKQRGENRYTILENGSFTSCLPGSDTWSVVGSEVIHDREEQVAEIWNARFKLGSVPIFYSPYLQLPVGDKRRSGFLIPNAKYSTKNGVEFSLPYYWNIAPNFDATITPHYMNKRGGVMWENEFRYLTQLGSGLTEFDYLPSDKVYEDDHSSDIAQRGQKCIQLIAGAGELDGIDRRRHVDNLSAEDFGVALHFFTAIAAGLNLHQHNFAFNMSPLPQLADPQDIHQLVQLLFNLLNRFFIAHGLNGHSGESGIVRRRDSQAFYIIATLGKEADNAGQCTRFVFQ